MLAWAKSAKASPTATSTFSGLARSAFCAAAVPRPPHPIRPVRSDWLTPACTARGTAKAPANVAPTAKPVEVFRKSRRVDLVFDSCMSLLQVGPQVGRTAPLSSVLGTAASFGTDHERN